MALADLIRSRLEAASRPAFVLLDAAAFPQIEAFCEDHAVQFYESVWHGEPDAAPYFAYMVGLEPGTEAASALLDCVAAGGGVVGALSEGFTLNDAAIHWRNINPVQTPDGDAYVLRYFQPSMMLALLSVLSQEELETLMGPTQALLVPQPGGRRLTWLGRTEAGFESSVIETAA